LIELLLSALGPWRSPLLAFAAALGAALVARARPSFAGLAAGVGVVAGLFDVFGAMLITPRMLPERLPWLALAAAAAGAVSALVRPRLRTRAGLLGAAALAASWWMVGAPRSAAGLAGLAGPFAAVAASFVLALAPWRQERGMRPAVRAALAAAVLAVGLRLAGAPMLFIGLAACVGAAALGALAGMAGRAGARLGDAGLLPLAASVAGTGCAAALAWPGALVPAAAAGSVLVLASPWPGHGKENGG
jgi:hypothetical protein